MMSITCILFLAALIIAIWSGVGGRPPLWIAVVLIAIAGLLGCLPR